MPRFRDLVVSAALGLALVLGGGFANATPGNAPAATSHVLKFTLASFRAIALSPSDSYDFDSDSYPFGYVRQGTWVLLEGPEIRYATTWAADRIYATITPASLPGIRFSVQVGSVDEPFDGGCGTATGSAGVIEPGATYTGDARDGVALEPFPVVADLITEIYDCGAGDLMEMNRNDNMYASTYLGVDASAASLDLDYTAKVTATVEYTIDQGV